MKLSNKLSISFTLPPLLFTYSQNISTKPNVIIIYTDDQGAIDLNCYGAKDLVTPNMDKLVSKGVKFTQFYGAPISSPSRAGLLTGKSPQRVGVPGNVSALSLEAGMDPKQYTIAEMFQDNGYKTAHIGKWHLGHSTERQPNHRGFDYSFGHYVGCIDNYSHFFYWQGPNRHDLHENGEEVFYEGKYFPDLMVEKATKFLEKNGNDPFFMYFAMNTPHYPYQGYTKWLDYYKQKGVKYPRDLYAAFISTQDEIIGKLLKKISDLGIEENTIIIFQADNGYSTEERAHFGGGNSGVFRGSKFSLFEGGIRVPAAICWPAKIPSGQVRDQMGTNLDWMPTLAELCDFDINFNDLDGKSLSPLIKDKSIKSRHADGFCWQNGAQWAVRKGDWKLIGNPNIADEKFAPQDSLFLINLTNDISESKNIASAHPQKVKELKDFFIQWQKKIQKYNEER